MTTSNELTQQFVKLVQQYRHQHNIQWWNADYDNDSPGGCTCDKCQKAKELLASVGAEDPPPCEEIPFKEIYTKYK